MMKTQTVIYETQNQLVAGVERFEGEGWAVRQIVFAPISGGSYMHESWGCVVVFECDA